MSEQTAANLRTAVQFKQVSTPSGKRAFEAYCATLLWNEQEFAICAPTLEKLEEAWRLCGVEKPLNREKAQFVWIVQAGKV